MTRVQRVQNLLDGKRIERPVIFDLIRNDTAIEYYARDKFDGINDAKLIYKIFSNVIDATRPRIRIPRAEGEDILPDGRRRRLFRWTEWVEDFHFTDSDEYEKYLQKAYFNNSFDPQNYIRDRIDFYGKIAQEIKDLFVFWDAGSPGLTNLYTDVGLENFSYFLADCPEAISEALEAITEENIKKIEALASHNWGDDIAIKPSAVFIGDDIAFNSGTIFSPSYLRKDFFPRLKRIIKACHNAGWQVMYHSDGNLMAVMDDLIETGMDILNPIDISAGMNIKELHRRYPSLIFAGGIDVAQLLPFATPNEVSDVVVKTIEDAEGQIMIGSSTEMHNAIPCENVIAVYDTVLAYRY